MIIRSVPRFKDHEKRMEWFENKNLHVVDMKDCNIHGLSILDEALKEHNLEVLVHEDDSNAHLFEFVRRK